MMFEKFKQLEYAKKSCIFLLENESGKVDCHGLEYWASIVVKLRKEIKESL